VLWERKRCIHDLILCVLQSVEDCEKLKTHVIHECKLDTRVASRLFNYLMNKGLITIDQSNSRYVVKITERGREVLSLLKQLHALLQT